MPDESPWSLLPSWQVLDTEFGSGKHFFQTCHAWQIDPNRPGVLHYVALSELVCSKESFQVDASDTTCSIRQTLSDQWHGLLPGFHRFLLQQGKIILTLCIGEKLTQIRSQRFLADAIEFHEPTLNHQDMVWLIKGLERCCKRGTRLHLHTPIPGDTNTLLSVMTAHGFDMTINVGGSNESTFSGITGEYQPKWQIKHNPKPTLPLPVQRCAVIGAGLAGASVAASLSRRGWAVTVLEKAVGHAAGASGLPVGLVNPHVSSDDCALSQLSRTGVRLTMQQANELLIKHMDWSPTGVFEKQVGGTPKLPLNWNTVGNEWSQQKLLQTETGTQTYGILHHQGAWLKPERLVNAWLNLPRVTLKTKSAVKNMFFQNGVWVLQDANGKTLDEAERVVFANASGAFELLAHLMSNGDAHFQAAHRIPPALGMRGLLSWSAHRADEDLFAHHTPINGSGSLISHIPQSNGSAWFMGSSYQPTSQLERSDLDNHLVNLAHLRELASPLAQHFIVDFESGSMHSWKGTRCVMKDRMPVVGALDEGESPSIWICAGLGSRGLSFSVLCAELLAAQFGAEPWPINPKLAKSLHVLRA